MSDKSDTYAQKDKIAKWTIREVPMETKRMLHKIAIERGLTIAEALALVVSAYVEQKQGSKAD